MLASLGLLSVFAAGQLTSNETVSIDVYAVGNNSGIMKSLDWLKTPDLRDPIQALLKPELDRMSQQKKDFAVIDGGMVSAFSKEREGYHIVRLYSGYDSAWQSTTKNGKKETHVVEHTESEETSGGNFNTKSASQRGGYMVATFWHLRRPEAMESVGKYSLAIQDYNSYITTRNTPVAQDRAYASKTLMMSNNSIQQTKALLAKSAPDFNGIAFCAYGLPDPSAPNLVPIPPAGKVAHYVITSEKGKWSIKLVEYLRNQ